MPMPLDRIQVSVGYEVQVLVGIPLVNGDSFVIGSLWFRSESQMQRGYTALGMPWNVFPSECIETGTGKDLKDLTVLQGLAEHERQNSMSARLGGDGNQSDKFFHLKNLNTES